MSKRDPPEHLAALPVSSVLTAASTTGGGHPQQRPRGHPHAALLPRRQRPRRRVPGTLLRGRVVARVLHLDRGDVPFEEEGDCLVTARPGSGAQYFDAAPGVSTPERVLRAVHWLMGRVCAYASRAMERKVPMGKLPAAPRGVGACQLRYVVLLWCFVRT